MSNYSRSSRYYNQFTEGSDSSALFRMHEQYWATKQAIFKRLGKKNDDCIIASDSELDSKLELFQAVEESCFNLMRVLENYQDKLCALSQEENAMGRFLKEYGKWDKTQAGKMMTATGKTMSYTAQQRLSLRMPLVRLYQEIDTFQFRAITDTFQTVEKMEKARTTYRGALMWMKDVSHQLDPDTCKQLERFRKVQGHVRHTKQIFDKLKIDTLQKVDLLSASRCNMFSHVLTSYQNALLLFWEKTAHTMNTVAKSFRGYQHYEFCMLKELAGPSKELVQATANQEKLTEEEEEDRDMLLFFDSEYHDDVKEDSSQEKTEPVKKTDGKEKAKKDDDIPLLILDKESKDDRVPSNSENSKNDVDLLTDNQANNNDKDDLAFLNNILSNSSENIPSNELENSFAHQWQTAFGASSTEKSAIENELESLLDDMHKSGTTSEPNIPNFLPSQLLEMTSGFSDMDLSSAALIPVQQSQKSDISNNLTTSNSKPTSSTSKQKQPATAASKKGKKDISAWFNLFADLDPLSNPDAIGKKKDDGDDDRNC
ncbi:islet cell autoantigen 1 [Centruroides vittatus]|uniref:islet cell autoantigen 1 n=1 Tax=Centruroides vittatus TaxID=120091 RepID=UPI00350EF49C